MIARRINIEIIDDQMADVFRRMDGAQRLRIASDMYSSARRMLMSHLRHTHSDWDDRQIAAEAARTLSHGTC